jgi:hypothetical protein
MMNEKQMAKRAEAILESLKTMYDEMNTYQNYSGDYTYKTTIHHLKRAVATLELRLDDKEEA